MSQEFTAAGRRFYATDKTVDVRAATMLFAGQISVTLKTKKAVAGNADNSVQNIDFGGTFSLCFCEYNIADFGVFGVRIWGYNDAVFITFDERSHTGA